MKLGLIGSAVVVGAMLIQGQAGATWPSGAAVTFPGDVCAAPFLADGYGHYAQYCPYISDSLHEGSDVPMVNVDLFANLPDADYMLMGLCAQSWTGSQVACFLPAINFGAGVGHMCFTGAGSGVLSQESRQGETSSPWDYYYVDIFWRMAENRYVYGYSFGDEACVPSNHYPP
jgi:hypothetical protein